MAAGSQELANRPAYVLVKRALPWVALALVAILALRAYGGYKASMGRYESGGKSAATTSTATKTSPAKSSKSSKPATKTSVPSAPTQVLIVKDVNFHKDPNLASDNYRMLKAGERLTLVGQTPEWYRVTDSEGNIGWVTVNKVYAKLAKGQ